MIVEAALKPKFLTFDEAVAAAKQEHDVDFIAIDFNEGQKFLATYTINVMDDKDDDEADDPNQVNIYCEGGILFDYEGDEEYYSEKDAPARAKELFYVHEKDLGKPSITGMTGEYVLFAVLPSLKEPSQYPSETHFVNDASRLFKEFWRF